MDSAFIWKKREVSIMSHEHFIDNEWVAGNGATFQSLNPSTESVIWEGDEASSATILEAIGSARTAFNSWREMPFKKRCDFVCLFQQTLALEKTLLATIISEETGKPLWETYQEVEAMLNKITISIEAHQERCLDKKKQLGNRFSFTRYKPHGVVVVLGPFNFPGHLPNGHIVPALLAGNTVVFKPSDYTPNVANFMMKLWQKVGLPPGVLNMVQGGGRVGELLVSHPEVKAIFFTGSSKVGFGLRRLLIDNPDKLLALEMGGNNPLIVSKYSDMDAVLLNIIQSAYITAGQRCTCSRRLIVVQNEQTEFLMTRLKETALSIKVGAYTDTLEPFMGPLVQPQMKQILIQAESDYKQNGAKVWVPFSEPYSKGYFLSPALLEVPDASCFKDEEFFGPMLVVARVDTLEDAVVVANDTQYGLSAGLLSENKKEYDFFYNTIRAGVVNWNVPTTGASSSAPFGGIKASGNFRPSAYYAADYCSYAVASLESDVSWMPEVLPPGIMI